MASPELNRREMLGIIGVAALGFTVSGLGARAFFKKTDQPIIPSYSQENFPPDEALFLPSAKKDTNTNPLYRAANVSITIGAGGSACASLIESGNRYLLSTAEHVATICEEQMSIAEIPGIGSTPLDPERFISGNRHGKEREASTYYVFGNKSSEIIYEAVMKGEVQPLKLKHSFPRLREFVALPRTIDTSYTLYEYKTYIPFENLLELKSLQEGCKGDSGAPILEIEEMQSSFEVIPTGYSYGTLQGAAHPYLAADGRECSSTIYARPNG